jgi:hypothetical protein
MAWEVANEPEFYQRNRSSFHKWLNETVDGINRLDKNTI